MRANWLLLLAAALVGPFAVRGDTSPQVVLASPGDGGRYNASVERFTLRFSEAMVPLGDPRGEPAATSDCAGDETGRWADERTFVLEFAKPLASGATCKVNLRDGLATLRGAQIGGTRQFSIDTGGPAARAVFAPGYDGEIDEDQVFLVAVNGAVDRNSVAAHASCTVDGIGEAIAVDVLGSDEAGRVLAGLGKSNWERNNFLSEAGMPEALPEDAKERSAALANVLALKCRRPLPPEHDMALVWPSTIAAPAGKLAGRDQRFDFTIRKSFTARFECDRVNAQASCNPILPVHVRLSAPIDRAKAMAVRLKLADGSERAPMIDHDTKGDAQLSDLEFAGPWPAESAATVLLPDGIADLSGRKLSNAERFPLAVKFDAAPPLVKFAANFGILEASEGGVLPVTVRAVEPDLGGKITSIAGKMERVAGSDAEIAEWLRKIDRLDDNQFETVDNGEDKEPTYINHTGEKPIMTSGGSALTLAMPGKGKDFEVVGIPLKQRGFHVVELASPALGKALLGRQVTRYVAAGALVTDMAVHFQWGRESSLVWVTALESGKPVAGAAVAVSDSCTGKQLATGTTDSSGRLLVSSGLPEPETGGGCEDEAAHPLMVSARLADDMSFTMSSWSQGITPWDFDLPYGWSEPQDIVHTVFDRALVRIGETVNMKHILRHPESAGFSFAKAVSGKLVLSHMGSETQFSMPVTIGATGTDESEWAVPQGAPLGDYALKFEFGEKTLSTAQSIRVDEYRLPTMRATITGPKEDLVQPGNVPLSLYVGYLSGGGAGTLPVTLRTDFSNYGSSPSGWDTYDFGGEPVVEGTRPLDSEGSAESVPLPLAQTLPATLGSDGTAKTGVDVGQKITRPTLLTVEMDYPDANGETLTASRYLRLYPAALQLGVKTDGWLMRDSDLRLKFVTLGLDGKPVKGRTVRVALYSREIITARRRLIGGFYAYDNQEKVSKLSPGCVATSDAQGLADCKIDPGVSGEVTVVATTLDSQGRETRAVRTVWLAGADEWWFGGDNGDRMDLVPEKVEYASGDTARLQVRMPFREATALVTVEREGVLSSFVTKLSGKNPVVEVKLPGSYAPNVYVSVMAVRGRVTGWRQWMADLAKSLGLEKYLTEGQSATATVDLAKPSYRLGLTKLKVGWEGHKLDVAVKAERDKYAVRETANVGIAVRLPNGKPAASADVAFVAVDEALLQLMPNRSWDVLDAMMGERSLEVVTSTGQMQVVGKRHYGKKAVAAGGGGGDASGVNRENFQPVLLWKGKVALDAKGQAQVAVPLSDALSRFRLVAIATDGAQLFGSGETSLRTSQNLTLYSGIPPLVRSGDLYDAVFTLRNGSDKAMKVTATPTIEPAFAKGDPLSVTIKAGGAATVRWSLTAPASAGPVRWTVEAKSEDGKSTDELTATQEVVPAVPLEVWAASLLPSGQDGALNIALPKGALAGGWVDVALSNSLAPSLDGVSRYMKEYPYECFEQRLSRIVVTGDNGGWTVLASALPTYLDSDGLLRYWPSAEMEGSPELTAYALAITSASGLALPDQPRARMIAALKNVAEGRLTRRRFYDGDERLVRVAAVSALARAKAADASLIATVDMVPADMPTVTLADWIAALDRVAPSSRITQLRAAAESELRRRFVYEGTRMDLTDQQRAPWWMMTSGDEMAVKALDAVLGKPAWSQDAPRMMTGVAQRQQRGHWDTTPANAWGSVLVRRFGTLYPASSITGTTRVSLGAGSATAAWPRKADAAPLRLPLVAGPLSVTQSGGAVPWTTVTIRAAVPLTAPLSAGYRLSREVKVVSARQAGKLSQGDVVRVKLTVEASADRTWVVINDPLPPGATVMSGLGGQSSLLAKGETSEGEYPSWTESQRGSWRAYYQWMPRGKTSIEYTLRLNGVGRFTLPPSRVEAMYSPAIRGQLPLAPVQVGVN